ILTPGLSNGAGASAVASLTVPESDVCCGVSGDACWQPARPSTITPAAAIASPPLNMRFIAFPAFLVLLDLHSIERKHVLPMLRRVDAALCHDCADDVVRRDIKSRGEDAHTLWRNWTLTKHGDFGCCTLLNFNVRPRRGVNIHR